MKHLTTSCVLAMSLVVASCGKDEKKSSSSSITGAAATSAQALSSVGKLALFTAAEDKSAQFLTELTKWSTGAPNWGTGINIVGNPEDNCDGDNTPGGYMDNMLNSNCRNSNFFDLTGLFRYSCAAFAAVGTSGGLPKVVADKEVPLSASIRTLCSIDVSADEVDQLPEVVATVTETVEDSIYQRKLSLKVDGVEDAYVIWYGVDEEMTYMQAKNITGQAKGILFYSYDAENSVTLFELQSRNSDDASAFFTRIHMDEKNNIATGLGTMGDLGDSASHYRWSFQGFVGDPADASDDDLIAVNANFKVASGTEDSFETCVVPSSKASVVTTVDANGVDCGTYAVPANISDIDSFIGDIASDITTDTEANLLGRVSEFKKVDFTAVTIKSAPQL